MFKDEEQCKEFSVRKDSEGMRHHALTVKDLLSRERWKVGGVGAHFSRFCYHCSGWKPLRSPWGLQALGRVSADRPVPAKGSIGFYSVSLHFQNTFVFANVSERAKKHSAN